MRWRKMKMTCIVCPNGCQLEVLVDEDDVADVSGKSLHEGVCLWPRRRLLSPTRTVNNDA